MYVYIPGDEAPWPSPGTTAAHGGTGAPGGPCLLQNGPIRPGSPHQGGGVGRGEDVTRRRGEVGAARQPLPFV